MNKKKTLTRVLSLLTAVLLLVGALCVLTSCGGGTTLDYNMTADEKYDLANGDKDGTVRKYIGRILMQDAKLRERFTAACRGYDMTAEGFNDNEATEDKGANVAAAKGVFASLLEKITDDTSKGAVTELSDALTINDMSKILTYMKDKSTIETADTGNFVDKLLLYVGKFMNWLTSLTGGFYAISIFIFALLIKIIFIPVSIKQQKNQIAMAKLRPKIAQIEKKYAGRTDQATLRKKQQEIMELQQAEGASVASGCLPMLIQLPIIIALYNIVTNPLRYVLGISNGISSALTTYATTAKAAGGLGLSLSSSSTIEMLSQAGNKLSGFENFSYYSNAAEVYANNAGALTKVPNFTLFGLDLGMTPSIKAISLLVLIPIIATAFQWLTMFLTRRWSGQSAMQGDAQTQASMRMMDIIFPAMTLFISFTLPAMLGLYWIYQSVLALLQSYLLQKLMPMPTYTPEQLKEMEKAAKAQEKAQRAAMQTKPKFKSLHYIDEDDYDTLPEIKSGDGDKNDKKGPLHLDAGELKDDRKNN